MFLSCFNPSKLKSSHIFIVFAFFNPNKLKSSHMFIVFVLFSAWCSSRMNRLTKGKEEHAMYFCRDNCLSQGVLHTMEKLKAQCMLELHKAHLLPSRDIMVLVTVILGDGLDNGV